MRLVWLYLRAHRTGAATIALLVIVSLGGLWPHLRLARTSTSVLDSSTPAPLLVFVPLAVACVIGASTTSPCEEIERLAYRSRVFLRLIHLGGLLLLSMMGLVILALMWPGPSVSTSLVRNLAGFVGLALLAALLFGGKLSWLFPIAWTSMSFFAPRTTHDGASRVAAWAWPVQPDRELSATIIAMLLFLSGFVGMIVLGERRAAQDVPAC